MYPMIMTAYVYIVFLVFLALRLNTTSAMFDVSAVPLEARLYAMTNGDIIENTEFSVTFELQDSFTGQTIEDINWRVRIQITINSQF